jgi:VanZ family protein
VPGFQICSALLTGKLVAGTGTGSDSAWRGKLAGLAILSRPLSPGEVRDDYNTWPGHPGPAFGNKLGLVALYPFDEGSGARVHDELSGANSFYMPDRYVVVAKRFLSPPSSGDLGDIVANVIGFIPLGFTLSGSLFSRWRKGTGVLATVLLCGLFSLIIEMLQWFLPTRDSDMTDVITNTAGAACGALLYRLSRVWLPA